MPEYTADEQRNIDTVNAMFGAGRELDRATLFADDAVGGTGSRCSPATSARRSTAASTRSATSCAARVARTRAPASTATTSTTNRFDDVVVLADGDFVVRQHTQTSTTLGGKPYRNVYCFVFRFNADGKIQYLTEHWNTWYAHRVLFDNFAVEPAPNG